VENLSPDQELLENLPALFRITASKEVVAVKVSANGRELGAAEYRPQDVQFRFTHTFAELGDFDLEFAGFAQGKSAPVARATYRVRITRDTPPRTQPRTFNAYVLKAVDYLNKNYGLLGYNVTGQITHPVSYYKYGVLQPTRGGQTMCVAGVLEVILTAFDIYFHETNDSRLYQFLPFKSWSSLAPDAIKASIWVNAKLHSAGTADALAKFGLGEKIKFKDLEPGGFININRTSGTGHAVVFLGFIDAKGRDLPAYGPEVAGFRYFGAQGRRKVGQGGFGFRHAFFSKFGCPEVPFPRDCKVIYSEDSRLLNVGQLLAPSEWKHPISKLEPAEDDLDGQGDPLIHSPAAFDGLTTDD
jgi:hypothetical protein